MRLALNTSVPPDVRRPAFHQRASSLVLAVGITFLIILAIWSLNVRTPERPRFKGTILIDFKPDADTTDTSPKQVPAKSEPKPQAEPKTPSPPKPVPPPPPQLPVVHPYYIPLTKEENDSADISRLPHAGPRGTGTAQPSTAGDSRPVGTAPDGQPLYQAEWYRRPTNAEVNFYLPSHMPVEGSGEIACKTIAGHHVEDCVELGSSPPGSHLAGAVRQAAWQFLVRPPRLGGKELVGAWVRIVIDYHTDKAGDGDKSPGEAAEQP